MQKINKKGGGSLTWGEEGVCARDDIHKREEQKKKKEKKKIDFFYRLIN